MRPAGFTVLHHAADDRRAWTLEHVVLVRKRHNSAVRGVNGGLEEFFRSAQRRARLLLKSIGYRIDGNFGCDLATCMAAHAICDYQQQHVLGIRIG